MAKGKKKGTPLGIDELLKRREVIGEDAYTAYWRRLNRARREGARAFNREGASILRELRQESDIFRAANARAVARSRSEAETYAREISGRVVRRDARGRFSKRGRMFQVIGGRS